LQLLVKPKTASKQLAIGAENKEINSFLNTGASEEILQVVPDGNALAKALLLLSRELASFHANG